MGQFECQGVAARHTFGKVDLIPRWREKVRPDDNVLTVLKQWFEGGSKCADNSLCSDDFLPSERLLRFKT